MRSVASLCRSLQLVIWGRFPCICIWKSSFLWTVFEDVLFVLYVETLSVCSVFGNVRLVLYIWRYSPFSLLNFYHQTQIAQHRLTQNVLCNTLSHSTRVNTSSISHLKRKPIFCECSFSYMSPILTLFIYETVIFCRSKRVPLNNLNRFTGLLDILNWFFQISLMTYKIASLSLYIAPKR